MSAEAQRIGNGNVQVHLEWVVGCVVKVALGVGFVQTDGRGNDVVIQCHHTDDELDGTSSTEGVTHFRFGGADVCLVSFIAHSNLDGAGFTAVVHRGACTVCVDINALACLKLSFIQSLLNCQTLSRAVGTGSRAVVSIA